MHDEKLCVKFQCMYCTDYQTTQNMQMTIKLKNNVV